MDFECSDRCGTGEWTIIDHETLLRECTDEQITMMIFYKATIRTPKKLYRRHIPEYILQQKEEHNRRVAELRMSQTQA